MRGKVNVLVIVGILVALAPLSAADDRIATGCTLVQNAQYVYGGLTPVSNTAGPICWLAHDALKPLAPFTDDVPGAVQNGAYVCQDVATVWRGIEGTCKWTMALGGGEVHYTQIELSCWPTGSGGESCEYAPTFHASAASSMPGHWILRASSQIRNWGPGGHTVVPGSARTIQCEFDTSAGQTGRCAAQVENLKLVAGNFNSYRWEGQWTLTYVDATGARHLQSYGAADGWLAQYY